MLPNAGLLVIDGVGETCCVGGGAALAEAGGFGGMGAAGFGNGALGIVLV